MAAPTITVGIAIGAIIGALISVFGNKYIATIQRKNKEDENIKLLSGELLSIIFHYSRFNIPDYLMDGKSKNYSLVKKKLKLSTYGNLRIIDKIELYGFLDAAHIRNIHQLSLVIRNADIVVADFLDNFSGDDMDTFREIKSRMKNIEERSEEVLSYISEERKELKVLIEHAKQIEEPVAQP